MSRGGRGCPSIKCVWKRSWCIGKSHRPSKGISGGLVGAGWKQLWPIGLSTVLCWSLLLLMALIHLWWYLSHLLAFEPLLSLRGSAIFNSPARTAPHSHPFTPVRWTQGCHTHQPPYWCQRTEQLRSLHISWLFYSQIQFLLTGSPATSWFISSLDSRRSTSWSTALWKVKQRLSKIPSFGEHYKRYPNSTIHSPQ